jgi:uncharacterized membrane protein
MLSVLSEWLNLILRWAHIMLGIGWIGASFFFIWLDQSLRKRDGQAEGIAGESWMVHGGGFYKVDKFTVAPETLPEELHWFKHEAYFTFITGFLLMVVIYYFGAEAYLIDRGKIDLAPWQAISISVASLAVGWIVYDQLCKSPLGGKTVPLAVAVFVLIAAATFLYDAVFSDRAAFLHIGAFIGTIMAVSVFGVIIPNQKKVVADLMAGRKPDPALGLQAKQRSLHNNYLTLPVVFMMVSNHYPTVFSHPYAPMIALGIVVAGALVRHTFNEMDAGDLRWTGKAATPAAALLVLAMVAVTGYRPDAAGSGEPVEFAEAQQIIDSHCVSCHAQTPTHESFEAAPKGVIFETPEQIRRYAAQIRRQAVLSDIMPLGNETEMTDEERQTLGAWIAQGAKLE